MVYDSIGYLLTDIAIFGSGTLFGILGLIFGISRGMTKKDDMWALVFASVSWMIALIAPNTVFAAAVFLAGAAAVTIAYLPLVKNLNESSVLTIAIIAILINLTIVIGSGSFNASLNWHTNLEEVQDSIAGLFGTSVSELQAETPETGLCTPRAQEEGLCENSLIGGIFEPLVFDVVSTVVNVASYIGKAIAFAGMSLMAPLIIIKTFTQSGVINTVVAYMFGLYALMWQLLILYQIVRFTSNKRV